MLVGIGVFGLGRDDEFLLDIVHDHILIKEQFDFLSLEIPGFVGRIRFQ